MTAPTPEQVAYARQVLDARRARAAAVLLCGEHVEHVAGLVFGYVDHEDAPTAGQVAAEILDYVVALLEPLMVTTEVAV